MAASVPPIDLDSLPQEVNEHLAHLATLPSIPTGLQNEFTQLLAVVNFSCNATAETERKIEEIYAEIHFAREQVLAAQRVEEEAVTMKKGLEGNIEAARKKAEEYRKEEAAKKESVAQCRKNIADLTHKLSAGSGWTYEQSTARKSMMTSRDNVERNLDNVTSVLKATRAEVLRVTDAVSRLEKENETTANSNAQLRGDADIKQKEAAMQKDRKLQLEEKLHSLQEKVAESKTELLERERVLKLDKVDIIDTEKQLRESKERMEKYLKEYDSLFRMTQKLTEDLEVQIHLNDTINKENMEKKQVLAEKQTEHKGMVKESTKVAAAKKLATDKIAEIEKERVGYENERDKLKLQIEQLVGADLKNARKEGELSLKKIEEKKREKEILTRRIGGSEKATALIYDMTKVNENSTRNLTNEMFGFMATVKNQRANIETLVAERERHEQEVEAANGKHFTAIEELKLQEVQISDLQKKIIDGGSRLKQQQNLYEAVRSDRNLYSKNLIESQEEIAEMKRRFKVMNHQIEQLKDEITSKDHALVKEHFNHHNVDKERESLKNELTKIRKQILSSEQIIANQKVEVQKLSQIIQEADEERSRQKKEYSAVMSERDILGNQLIKRNEELTTLYEKVKVQRSVLHHGELQYQDRIAEVNHLTKGLAALKKEKVESVQESSNQLELRQACVILERDLLQERTKIRALKEELDRPLNVHRWRHLESSDPSRYEMIRKIQSLQKRLITKTQEVMEKDSLIQEKEKLYVELKNILGRQPGPEVGEQIILYQTNLKEKFKQMKSMTEELEMYQQQVQEFRDDLTNISNQGRELKNQWIKRARKQQSLE
jgi:chromosome segregation ATPase